MCADVEEVARSVAYVSAHLQTRCPTATYEKVARAPDRKMKIAATSSTRRRFTARDRCVRAMSTATDTHLVHRSLVFFLYFSDGRDSSAGSRGDATSRFIFVRAHDFAHKKRLLGIWPLAGARVVSASHFSFRDKISVLVVSVWSLGH